jgi:hypothetical protein
VVGIGRVDMDGLLLRAWRVEGGTAGVFVLQLAYSCVYVRVSVCVRMHDRDGGFHG